MDLRHFIRRGQTLKLYKDLWRASRGLGTDDTVRETRDEIRRRFRLPVTDQSALPSLHREAKEALIMIEGAGKHKENHAETGGWAGTNPNGDDLRGRVGESWPFYKN